MFFIQLSNTNLNSSTFLNRKCSKSSILKHNYYLKLKVLDFRRMFRYFFNKFDIYPRAAILKDTI